MEKRSMNRMVRHILRHTGMLAGLLSALAVSLALAAPANAKPIGGITASFDPRTGVLAVLGDANKNSIAVSRDAAGAILVNGGAVAIAGGPSTVANTRLIEVWGLDKNDHLSLDAANGPLPGALMSGGDGIDAVAVAGGADAEIFTATAENGRVRVEI